MKSEAKLYAVMGAIAWEKVDSCDFSSLDIDVHPGLLRGE